MDKKLLIIFRKREKASVHGLEIEICLRDQRAAVVHTSRFFHLGDNIRGNSVRGKKRKIRKLCAADGSLQFLYIESVKTSAFLQSILFILTVTKT